MLPKRRYLVIDLVIITKIEKNLFREAKEKGYLLHDNKTGELFST